MKRAVIFILLVIFLLNSYAVPVNALWYIYPEGEGMYIPDALRKELEKLLEDGDEVVGGLKTVSLHFGLSLVESFDQDFWTTEAYVRSIIIKKQDASIKVAINYNGNKLELCDIEDVEPYGCVSHLLKSPERVLSKTGKKTANMPAVFMFYDNYDCAVYFQLENEEYVYMRNHSSGTEYLFYADTYLKYAKWQRSEARFLWDLSVYDINSPDFDLDAPTPDVVIRWIAISAVGVVIAGGLILGFTIRRRKKCRIAEDISLSEQ